MEGSRGEVEDYILFLSNGEFKRFYQVDEFIGKIIYFIMKN